MISYNKKIDANLNENMQIAGIDIPLICAIVDHLFSCVL